MVCEKKNKPKRNVIITGCLDARNSGPWLNGIHVKFQRCRRIILLSYIGIQPSHYEDPLSTNQHHEITNHCSNHGFSKSWPDNEKKTLFWLHIEDLILLPSYPDLFDHYKNRPTTMMRWDLDMCFFSWPKRFKC